MDRKYSVSEIDRMRWAISGRLLRRGPMDSDDLREETEARLRTYMLAGVDPVELEGTPRPHPGGD